MILPCTHRPRYGDAGLIPSDLSRGLISAYLLNEVGGNYAYDIKRGVRSSLSGESASPSWTAIGLSFLANAQRVITALPTYDNGTLHLGYKRTITGGSHQYLIEATTTDTNFRIISSYDASFTIRIGGVVSTAGNLVADYRYHDIIITWGGGVVSLYLDGVKRTWDSGGTYTSVPNDTILIGSQYNSKYSAGVISYCYFFNRVMQLGEILQLSKNPYSLFYSKSENLIRSIWAVSSGTPEYVSLTISSESDISLSALRRRFLSLLIDSVSDSEITASRKRFSSASIESISDTSIDVLRRRYLSLAIYAESNIESVIYRKRYAECLIESVSGISVYIPSDAVELIIESVSDIAITAMRQRSVSANVASVSDVDVLALRMVYAAMSIASESDIDIDLDSLVGAVNFSVFRKGNFYFNILERKSDVYFSVSRDRNYYFNVERYDNAI